MEGDIKSNVNTNNLNNNSPRKYSEVYDWDGSGFGCWDGKPFEIKKSDGEHLIQIDRILFTFKIKKPFNCWWKLMKPSNVVKGIPYSSHPEIFGNNYKRLYKELNKLEYKKLSKTEKAMMASSNKLIVRKDSIIDDRSFVETVKK